MEPIANLPPQPTPTPPSAIANQALASIQAEETLLKEMAEEKAMTPTNLGQQIDLKA
jgi:hypothetical protein